MDDIEHRRIYPLFCRNRDLSELRDRLTKQGITVIASRPQMGKTRLMVEFLHDLKSTRKSQYLIGYAEGTNDEQDLLLRAVQSLYIYWAEESTLLTRVKWAWNNNKAEIICQIGSLTASILEKIYTGSDGSVSALIADVIKSLVAESHDHALTVAKLSYEQCFELLTDVYRISEKPIVLVLDAFEQIPQPLTVKTTLSQFLSFLQKWPPVHMYIAVRNTYPKYILTNERYAWTCIEDLKRASALVHVHQLTPLHTDEDVNSLLSFVRKNVPAAQHMASENILDLLAGHPGVLRRWLDTRCETIESMKAAAEDAFDYKYTEITEIFAKLFEEGNPYFSAAVFYALAPEINSIDRWNTLAQTMKDVDHRKAILDLCGKGLLSAEESYPCFGLTMRYQVARYTVIKKFRSQAVDILQIWKQELNSQSGEYLSAVNSYVATLLDTLEPDLAEKQLSIRNEAAIRQAIELGTASLMKEVASLR